MCLLHAPELIGEDGLPDPAKIKDGCLVDDVFESEAGIHALFLASATTNKDGMPLSAFPPAALLNIFIPKRGCVADETKVEVSRCLKGRSLDIAEMRLRGEVEVTVGKAHLSFQLASPCGHWLLCCNPVLDQL